MVLGMEPLHDLLRIFRRLVIEPRKLDPPLIDKLQFSLRAAKPDDLWSHLGKLPEFYFTGDQGRLGAFALDQIRRLSGEHVQQAQLAFAWFVRAAEVRRKNSQQLDRK